MIDIGISTASLFLKTNVEDSFEIIEKLGCKVVEVFLTTFSEYKKEFAEILKGRVKNVKVHSVHSLNNHYEPELFNASPRTQNDAEEIMRNVLNVGKEIGAEFYTFHGPARLKNKPYNVNFPEFGKRVERLNDICKEYGIELCYENVHWAYYYYPGFFKKLKDNSPNVKCTLDIKQAMQSGYDVYEYMDDMGDSIKTVHLCDVVDGKTCLPGTGKFDFCRFFEEILKRDVQAPQLLEVYSGDYQTYDDLAKSLDYLRDCLRKVIG